MTRTLVSLCMALVPAAATAQQDSLWLATKGFWQRAPESLLHADAQRIRELDGRRLRDLLEPLPRIELRELEGERYFVLHSSDAWQSDPDDAPCVLAVYLNGGRVTDSRGGPATIAGAERVVDVRRLDGIELYPTATAPVDGVCGAVLAWSQGMVSRIEEDFVGHLRGRALLVPGEKPAGGIDIVMQPGDRTQRTSSAGWFEFGRIPPGRYTLTASVGEATWTGVVVVRAFVISQIVIEVESG